MRIYADFNGLQTSPEGERQIVPLDSYGTLCDLCEAKFELSEGVRFVIYSDSSPDEDLEADATAVFSPKLNCWVAEIDVNSIRHVPTKAHGSPTLSCIRCNADLNAFVAEHGLCNESTCPVCGVLIWLPILPPQGGHSKHDS